MSKPHTKLTFCQISSVVARVVGRRLGSVPRKMFLLNFEPTGKTPTSFQNKRCRVIITFFIELTQLNPIRRPKAKTERSKTKFLGTKNCLQQMKKLPLFCFYKTMPKIAVKTFSLFDLSSMFQASRMNILKIAFIAKSCPNCHKHRTKLSLE